MLRITFFCVAFITKVYYIEAFTATIILTTWVKKFLVITESNNCKSKHCNHCTARPGYRKAITSFNLSYDSIQLFEVHESYQSVPDLIILNKFIAPTMGTARVIV